MFLKIVGQGSEGKLCVEV